MESTHIVTKFDSELNKIEQMLLDMSKQVGEQILNAGKALLENGESLAKSVVRGDVKINKLENKIDARAIRLIALRQPMAEDFA